MSPTVKPRDQLPSLFTPEFYRNPYPAYATLRRSDPVHWDEEHQVRLLTRYADVAAALAEPRLARGAGDLKVEAEDPLRRVLSRMMLFSEPPRHTRLRALATRAFTPRRVEAMRPRIQAIVDELLDAIDGRHELDVIANLAYPLPVMVISEILSLPSADLEQFKRWSDDVIAYSAGATEAEGRARDSVRALLDYFRELAAHLRRSPDGSIMSALVEAETEGSRLDEEELLANAILLLMNGHETTTDTIANGVLALLQHSEQLDKLRRRRRPARHSPRQAVSTAVVDPERQVVKTHGEVRWQRERTDWRRGITVVCVERRRRNCPGSRCSALQPVDIGIWTREGGRNGDRKRPAVRCRTRRYDYPVQADGLARKPGALDVRCRAASERIAGIS